MILFCAAGANSLAPHTLLREAGLSFQLEKVDLTTKRWQGGDYRAITRKSYVPALRLDDGDILTECGVILTGIADQVPGRALMPSGSSRARYHACAGLNFLATEAHGNFIAPERHGGVAANLLAKTAEGQAATRALVAPRLAYIDEILKGRRFLTGDAFAAPDAYLFVMLMWAWRLAWDLAPWARLGDYFECVASRPAVVEARRAEARRTPSKLERRRRRQGAREEQTPCKPRTLGPRPCDFGPRDLRDGHAPPVLNAPLSEKAWVRCKINKESATESPCLALRTGLRVPYARSARGASNKEGSASRLPAQRRVAS